MFVLKKREADRDLSDNIVIMAHSHTVVKFEMKKGGAEASPLRL